MGSILYYEESGSGFPLILLHGNGEDWRCFERQIGPFAAAGYRVVTLDSRGHGASKRGTLPMTPQQLAADALDALVKGMMETIKSQGGEDEISWRYADDAE